MQPFTKKDKKKYKIILFFKSINCHQYIYIYISQIKTYFCYFNIAFEMSRRVVLLLFGVLNTKYLPFRTFNATTLILGWLRFFLFFYFFIFCLFELGVQNFHFLLWVGRRGGGGGGVVAEPHVSLGGPWPL